MAVSSPGMANQNRIRPILVEDTPSFIRNRDRTQGGSNVQSKGTIFSKGKELSLAWMIAGAPCAGHRQGFSCHLIVCVSMPVDFVDDL
jgi:hypothetical protein